MEEILKTQDDGQVFGITTLEGEGENGEDIYQSVVPEKLAKYSTLHSTREEAILHLRAVATLGTIFDGHEVIDIWNYDLADDYQSYLFKLNADNLENDGTVWIPNEDLVQL